MSEEKELKDHLEVEDESEDIEVSETEDTRMFADPIEDEEPDNVDELIEYYKMFFPEWKVSSTVDLLNHLKESLGEEELNRQHTQYGSLVERLIRQLDAHTSQSSYALEALKYLSDEVGEAYVHTPTDETDVGFTLKNRTLSPKNLAKTLKGSEVNGREARLLILGVNRNVKKCYLYNSGFSVVLKAPLLVEINLIYNLLSEKQDEYGRLLGAIYYMYSDYKIKSAIWDFIRPLIIDSNLKKSEQGNRLRDNISIQDYPQLLLMALTLMFKDGYDYLFVCHNKNCKHERELKIDLNLLQLTDFGRIPHDQLKFLANATNQAVEPSRLAKYRKVLIEEPVFNIGIYRITRKVPTLTEYFTYGEAFNEELAMSISDLRDREGISQYLRYNYARVFEPWISKVEIIDEETKEVAFTVKGRDDIALILSQIQNSEHDEELAKQMNNFIQSSNVSHVGYLAQACPECKTMPDNTNKGYVAFDVQTAFFTAAVRALVGKS